jgi:hypothetical protein
MTPASMPAVWEQASTAQVVWDSARVSKLQAALMVWPRQSLEASQVVARVGQAHFW